MSTPTTAVRARRSLAALAVALVLAVATAGCRRETATLDPDTIPEAFVRSTAALMWPGTTRSIQITAEGNLYNGEWLLRFEPSAGGAQPPAPSRIAFEGRWCPVAHWNRTAAGVRWEFEATALPATAPADTVLIASVQVTAVNTTARPAQVQLGATLAPPAAPDFVAFDAPQPAPAYAWSGAAADTIAAWCRQASAGNRVVRAWMIPAGERRTMRFTFPTQRLPRGALDAWSRRSHDAVVDEARRSWHDQVGRGAQFQLSDPETENALRAARVTLLCCRERHGTRWLPIGNPYQYRDVWLRDGARVIDALSVLGYTPEARQLAAGFLGFQWPAGAFLSQRGQLDGTGQALWAMQQAMLRPAPAESLAAFAQAAVEAVRWCEWQRALGRSAGWPFGTMLPFGDPRDGELVRAQLVGNDAWTLRGYQAAAALLRATGRAAEADSVDGARTRYLTEFRDNLRRVASRDVPPSWQGIGRDAGNVSVAYPCGALAADDPRCAALAARVWGRAGGAGLLTYGTRDSLQSYFGSDLAVWALTAGHATAADSVLEAMLHWRTASGGFAELFSRTSRDFGRNLPPHATGAAALIDVVRNMLICDAGDTLRLTLGGRDAWWRDGAMRGAVTRWGTLDLAFHRTPTGAAWHWSRVPVWTALTVPRGWHVKSPPAAPLLATAAGTVLDAPPGTTDAAVELARDTP